MRDCSDGRLSFSALRPEALMEFSAEDGVVNGEYGIWKAAIVEATIAQSSDSEHL
jgi:hypothetical protein